jgi:hypothetical protein
MHHGLEPMRYIGTFCTVEVNVGAYVSRFLLYASNYSGFMLSV